MRFTDTFLWHNVYVQQRIDDKRFRDEKRHKKGRIQLNNLKINKYKCMFFKVLHGNVTQTKLVVIASRLEKYF